MEILNYTTTIDVRKTVGEIQSMLAKAGAKSIILDYDNGRIEGIRFLIATNVGDRGFTLPADASKVRDVLVRQCRAGKVAPRFTSPEQAERVAWRIMRDWLAAQLAMIETQMVTFPQIMLPYMIVEGGISLFEVMTQNRLALPAPCGKDRRWIQEVEP